MPPKPVSSVDGRQKVPDGLQARRGQYARVGVGGSREDAPGCNRRDSKPKERRAYVTEAGGSIPSRAVSFRQRNRWGVLWRQRLGRPECPYLERWALETPFGSLRLHHWIACDDPRAFHDHPWWFLTVVLAGSYTDLSPAGRDSLRAGNVRFRPALYQHTVEVASGGTWTLLLTGPHVRFWGFWRRGKWTKSNRYFLEEGDRPCS